MNMISDKQASTFSSRMYKVSFTFLIILALTLINTGNCTVCFPTPMPFLFGASGGDTKINTF
jgi:hypothetical protein